MKFGETEITTSQLVEILQMNYVLRSQDLNRIALTIETDILTDSARIIPILPLIWENSTFNDIYRVSINKTIRDDKANKRLERIQDLKYPPKEKAKNLGYNRCSFKGQAIFYGGFGDFFALVENKPQKGDLITISRWRIKPNLDLYYVPIFQDKRIIESSNEFNNEWDEYNNELLKLSNVNRTAVEIIYSLITYFFTRKVENKIEYIFSAYFANKFLNSSIQKIEAIFYPSVASGLLAHNIAVPPEIFDMKFDFLDAREYLVLFSDSGGWITRELSICDKLIENHLIWETLLSRSEVNQLLQEFEFEL